MTVAAALIQAVAEGPVVLDGGLATRLEARGHDLSDDLWSARLLLDDPDEIVGRARGLLRGRGPGRDHGVVPGLVRGARRARGGPGRDQGAAAPQRRAGAAGRRRGSPGRWVAASVGPYGATLADGEEYTGDYGLTVDELRAWHRPRLAALVEAEPDVLAWRRSRAWPRWRRCWRRSPGTGARCWLSLTADGDRTRRGEPLREAFAMARDVPEIVAVGVNCCTAATADVAVATAAGARASRSWSIPTAARAGTARPATWRGQSTFHPERVTAWVDAGARLVGGCCRVGPDEIAADRPSGRLSEAVTAPSRRACIASRSRRATPPDGRAGSRRAGPPSTRAPRSARPGSTRR